MGYEAILFDMDGVIVDTYQSVTEFWQNIAKACQVHLTQADFNQHVYGCPATRTLDFLFPHLNTVERQSILAKMANYEANLTYTGVKGATDFLRTLEKKSIPTALVTSGDQWKVNKVINQLGIDGMFTVQVTVGDVQRGKPHPDCYLLAAQYLQKSPEQCIVFEDSFSGVKAAVASGALCIGIGPSSMASSLLQAGAYYVVPDFIPMSLLSHKDHASTPLILRIGAEYSLPLSNNQEEAMMAKRRKQTKCKAKHKQQKQHAREDESGNRTDTIRTKQLVRKIQVVPHDPNWPKRFKAEADELTGIFGQEVAAIHHIGSTAIPGICAKPIIDVLVEVHDIEKIDDFNEETVKRGYQPKGEFGIPERRFFIKGDDANRTHHIHTFQTGNPEVERYLDFRDYMIAHPEEARAYSRLKEELAQRFPKNIEGYMAGKDGFIKEIDRKAQAWRGGSQSTSRKAGCQSAPPKSATLENF